MVYNCKNICEVKYKQVKVKFAQSYYDIPDCKFCAICETFIKWEGVWCPCCSVKLRTKKKYKGYLERKRRQDKQRQSLNMINITVKV